MLAPKQTQNKTFNNVRQFLFNIQQNVIPLNLIFQF